MKHTARITLTPPLQSSFMPSKCINTKSLIFKKNMFQWKFSSMMHRQISTWAKPVQFDLSEEFNIWKSHSQYKETAFLHKEYRKCSHLKLVSDLRTSCQPRCRGHRVFITQRYIWRIIYARETLKLYKTYPAIWELNYPPRCRKKMRYFCSTSKSTIINILTMPMTELSL